MCCFTRLELRLTLLLLIVVTLVNGFSSSQHSILNYKRFSSQVPAKPRTSASKSMPVLWDTQSFHPFGFGPGRYDQTPPPAFHSYRPYRLFQAPQKSVYVGLPYQTSQATQPNFQPVPESQYSIRSGMPLSANTFLCCEKSWQTLNPRSSHMSDKPAQRIQPNQKTFDLIQWSPQPSSVSGKRPYIRHQQSHQASSPNVIRDRSSPTSFSGSSVSQNTWSTLQSQKPVQSGTGQSLLFSRLSQGNYPYQRSAAQHPDGAANARLPRVTTKPQELERPEELNRSWPPSSDSGAHLHFSRIFRPPIQRTASTGPSQINSLPPRLPIPLKRPGGLSI